MHEPDYIFPLRLSDFENYAFRDDTPNHPMIIVLRTAFEGVLNEAAFRNALDRTLHDNPLLRATVNESGWHMKWQLLENHKPVITSITYSSDHPPVDCPPRFIDLTRTPGVEFELRLCPARGSLIAYFHHACVDGLGAIRFIGDVFACYGQQTANGDEERPTTRVPDPEVLLLRGTHRWPGRDRRAPVLHTLMETWRLFARKSYRLVRHSPRAAPIANEKVQNIVHTQVLPRSVLKQLKKAAMERGVTINDLCMMAFLQLIAASSSVDPNARPGDLFRILMPVSMRRPEHDGISAANVVSYVFHSFRRNEIQQPESLLAAIHNKSCQMINRNEGAAMLHGFALCRWIPGLFRLTREIQPDFASAVMTNVGEVRRIFENRFPMKHGRAVAGNVVVQRIDGVAPVRENTNLTMAFGTYGGELIMHLNRNTRIFSATDAEEFLDNLTTQLKSIAQTNRLQIQNNKSATTLPQTGQPHEGNSVSPEGSPSVPLPRASL